MADAVKEEAPTLEADAEMAAAEKPDAEAKEEAKEAATEEAKEAATEEAKEAAPKEPEKPKELEEDAPADSRPRVAPAATFNAEDTTLNAVPASDGKLLLTLAEGGFQHLLAGARASVGVKSGRYMFEVVLLGDKQAQPQQAGQPSQQPQQRPQVVRLGFSTAGSSLLLGDGEENVFFDVDGFFVGRSKKRVSQKIVADQVVAVLLNLDAASPNANTVSIFRNGVRACEPQPLPEALLGRTLFPTLSIRGATLRLNFAGAPLHALPFSCRMVRDAAAADCEVAEPTVPADGRCEVAVPVALPDEGGFDWVDQFLSKHPRYVELSSRALIAWAEKSGVWRKTAGKGCNDRPEASFGVPQLDDLTGLLRLLGAVAPTAQRNYIVPEVRSNLLTEGRKSLLERFAGFRKTGYVMVGAPSESFKEGVHAAMLREKRAKAEAEAKKKRAEAERKKLLEAKRQKAKAAKAAKEGEAEAEAEEKKEVEAEAEPEEIQVELTEEEKKATFRKRALPDLLAPDLAKAFTKFSLPEKDEGFDDISFEWQAVAGASEYLKEWMLKRKATQRVEELQPSKWFKDTWAEWQKALLEWKKKQTEWKKVIDQLQQWKKEGKEGDDKPTDMDSDDIDPMRVENICDVGNGEPLFSKFEYEDWCLLSLRYELHLLVHAFRRDLDDEERKTFHETHLVFYYNRYFKKPLDLKTFNVSSTEALFRMIQDTMALDASSGMLEGQLADDSPVDSFVKLAEEHRRDRQRRLDAGDESAELKFMKPTPARQAQAAQAAGQWQKTAAQRPSYAPTQRVGAQKNVLVPPRAVPTARPAGPAVVGAKVPYQAPARPGVQPLRSPTAGVQAAGMKRPFAPAPKAGLIQPSKQARTAYTGGRGW